MGSPKAFAKLAGRELLEHAIEATAPLPLTIAAREREPVREALLRYGWTSTREPAGEDFERQDRRCRIVVDTGSATGPQGPLAGVAAGLEGSDVPAWVLACDMPFVTPALGQALFSLLRGFEDTLAAVPAFQGHLHGTCAVYAAGALPAARDRLERGELSLAGLLASIPHVRLEGARLAAIGDPGRLLFNVNRADELEWARQVGEAERDRTSRGR